MSCLESEKLAGEIMYTIGDFLIQLKNAYRARKRSLQYPYVRVVKNIAELLVEEGHLASVQEKEQDGKKVLVATLIYRKSRPGISDVKLLSKPSLHRYATRKQVARTVKGMGIEILTTSRGIMTNKKAQKEGVGGEVICRIY